MGVWGAVVVVVVVNEAAGAVVLSSMLPRGLVCRVWGDLKAGGNELGSCFCGLAMGGVARSDVSKYVESEPLVDICQAKGICCRE